MLANAAVCYYKSSLSVYGTTSSSTSVVLYSVCVFIYFGSGTFHAFQRFGAILDALNAREYSRHSLELVANAPRLSYRRDQTFLDRIRRELLKRLE